MVLQSIPRVVDETMFRGEKTKVFWWGLMISGAAVVVLFTVLWGVLVLGYYDWRNFVPFIFGGVVFLLIGYYMMVSNVKREDAKAES